MEMLKLALKSGLPLVYVRTDDIINVEEVLSFIAEEPVKPLQVPEVIQKVAELKVPQGRLHFTSSECKSLVKLYHFCVEHEKTIVFVNTEKSVLQFDGGQLVPPKELVHKFLTEISEEPDELLPSFGGLTLKDVGEVAKMTMTRDEALTPRGVNETRRGYKNLKGIAQVDTNLAFYKEPVQLAAWLENNANFFMSPVHESLMPRGLLFDGPPGCLSGDTVMLYKRGKRNSGRPIRLESLYRRFNGLPDGKNPPRIKDAPTYLHSMQEDGSLRYNRIISIIESGEKDCVRVITKLGNTLTLTPDHPVCLAEGEFIPAGELQSGMQVRVKGSMIPTGTQGKKKREVHRREICVSHHPVAGTKVVEGYVYKRLHFSRVVVEAHMNGLPLESYVRRLNEGKLEGLKFLSSDQEVHHIDEDVRNDKLSNLVVMNKTEHAKYHGKVENFKVEYVADDEVVSVTPVGKVMTYDIQMNMPCHNFVAENFIVHNTGKTLAAKHIASTFGIPLYRLDVGAMKGKYVGESEGNLLAALAQVDQVEPCVVIFDEVEKIFQSQGDSGVTTSLLSQLLWWLQEHKSKVFTVMTTNDLRKIPAELYREGRIDATMAFLGVDGFTDGYEFSKGAFDAMLEEVGNGKKFDLVPAYKELQKRIKSQYADQPSVPQAKLTQEAYTLVKEVLSGVTE